MSTQAELTDAAVVQAAMAHQIFRTNKQIEALTRAIDRVDDATDLQVKGTLLKTYASQIEGHHHFVELPDYRDPDQTITIQLDITKSIMANAEAYFHQYRKDKRGLQTVISNRNQAEADLKQQLARQAGFDPESPDQVAAIKQQLITEGALKTKVLHSSKAPEPAHPRRVQFGAQGDAPWLAFVGALMNCLGCVLQQVEQHLLQLVGDARHRAKLWIELPDNR